jgi:hypothetical protein
MNSEGQISHYNNREVPRLQLRVYSVVKSAKKRYERFADTFSLTLIENTLT